MSKIKQKILLLMAIIFIFTVMLACSGNEPRTCRPYIPMITLADTLSFGYWELVAVSGGFLGLNWAEPSVAGITSMKIFISEQNKDLSFDYEWHRSDTLWEKGKITLVDTVPDVYGHRKLSMSKDWKEFDMLYRFIFYEKDAQLFMDLECISHTDAFIFHFRKILEWL